MRTLNLYVIKELLYILFAAIGILSFGMVGGNLLQVFQFISRGIPLGAAIEFVWYIIPSMLSFTIPWGILVSVLLLFGRMSANNEITAMRACGISIFQIISPLIILTFCLTVVCIYLQAYLGPVYLQKARDVTKYIGLTSPEALIVPGQPFSQIERMVLYIKNKNLKNEIKDIQIFTFDKERKNVEQDISAANGKIVVDRKTGLLTIVLYNYNIISYKGGGGSDRILGKEFSITIDTAKELNRDSLVRKDDFLSFPDLFGRISLYRKLGIDTTDSEVSLNFRMAMALSPISFLLLGLPLAIRTSRKETSIGLFLSVILAGIYFFFLIGCQTMISNPKLYPQVLVWIPNVLYQLGGFYFLNKITRR